MTDARADTKEEVNPYNLYILGEYEKAAPLLKKLATNNRGLAQLYYADIKHRGLDGKPSSLHKAAMYYILAACNGIEEAIAMLEDEVPGIMQMEPQGQMAAFVATYAITHGPYIMEGGGYDHAAGYFDSIEEWMPETTPNLLVESRQRDRQEGTGHLYELATAYIMAMHLGAPPATKFVAEKLGGIMEGQTLEEQIDELAEAMLLERTDTRVQALTLHDNSQPPDVSPNKC